MALSWWKKVYGKLACIIGQYMQKYNLKKFQEMSDLGGPFHNFWSWTPEMNLKIFPILGGGSFHGMGPIHKIWYFSRFAACITIGLFWRKTN